MHTLRAAGVTHGSTIAAMLANTREYFEVLIAAAHGGFAVVPVNWHWVTDELAYVLDDAGAMAFLADARFAEVAGAASSTPANAARLVRRIWVGESIAGFEGYEAFVAGGDRSEPVEQTVGGPMFYTSGTTGRPKGVRGALSGEQRIPADVFALIAAGFAQSTGLPAAPVTMLDGPLYHSAQWAFSMLPLFGGSSVVMRVIR